MCRHPTPRRDATQRTLDVCEDLRAALEHGQLLQRRRPARTGADEGEPAPGWPLRQVRGLELCERRDPRVGLEGWAAVGGGARGGGGGGGGGSGRLAADADTAAATAAAAAAAGLVAVAAGGSRGRSSLPALVGARGLLRRRRRRRRRSCSGVLLLLALRDRGRLHVVRGARSRCWILGRLVDEHGLLLRRCLRRCLARDREARAGALHLEHHGCWLDAIYCVWAGCR
jgi:hypothetical protein